MEKNRPGGSPDPKEPINVGAVLARLRRSARLTGKQLGDRVGMSQAKISKIETGASLPDPADVLKLADAVGASRELARELAQQAERAHNTMADWRTGFTRPVDLQLDYADLESRCRVNRSFQHAVVPGLLQTSEYARAILTGVRSHWSEDGTEAPLEDIAEAVSARVKRQEVLVDPQREHRFLLAETVFLHRLCRPEDMPAQLQRIGDLAAQENITIKVVPLGARWPCPPMNGFEIFDDSCIVTELFNTMVISRGKTVARLYAQVYDDIEGIATAEIEPILDHYVDLYLELARNRQRGRT